MKQVFAIFLFAVIVLSLAACGKQQAPLDTGFSGRHPYFIAKAEQFEDSTILIAVTDPGNSGIAPGAPIRISTKKLAGVLADDPATVTGNYILIEFDGIVMESYPLQLGEIFQITVTDENGNSIE